MLYVSDEGQDKALSILPSMTSATSQSTTTTACVIELNLSAVSLPPAIADNDARLHLPSAASAKNCHHCGRTRASGGHACVRPSRDVRVTGAYTLKPSDGVASVLLSMPKLPLCRSSAGRQGAKTSRPESGGVVTTSGSATVRTSSATLSRRHGDSRHSAALRPNAPRPEPRSACGLRAAQGIRSAPTSREEDALTTCIVSEGSPRPYRASLAKAANRSMTVPGAHRVKTVNGMVRSRDVVGESSSDTNSCSPRTPRTAPASTTSRQPRRDGGLSAPMQADVLKALRHTHIHRLSATADGKGHSIQRALIAPAWRRETTRTIEKCCEGLPDKSGAPRGAGRLLHQWDHSSRVQRSNLLRSLADQLEASLRRWDNTGMPDEYSHSAFAWGSWTDERGKMTKDEASAWGDCTVPAHEIEHTLEKCTHPSIAGDREQPFPTGSVERNFVTVVKERAVPLHAFSTPHKRNGNSDSSHDNPSFLQLLGPHAGLLAMRVASHLKTCHAGGHAIGPCLRVSTLLAQAARRHRYSVRSNDTTASTVLQHFSAPDVVQTALEVIADSGREQYERLRKNNHQRSEKVSSTVSDLEQKIPSATTAPNPRLTSNTHETWALRLLLEIVRTSKSTAHSDCTDGPASFDVEGFLTCPRPAMSTFVSPSTYMDAVECILKVLCQQGNCGVEARSAGGQLLVELGCDNPRRVVKVWDAVLCLLGPGLTEKSEIPENSRPTLEGQILACQIATELLLRDRTNVKRYDAVPAAVSAVTAGSIASPYTKARAMENNVMCSGFGNERASISSVKDAATIDSFTQQVHPRVDAIHNKGFKCIPPEVLLVPPLLCMAQDGHPRVQKTVRNLATLLARFPGPCCYLLAVGISGMLGRFSGVDRGAPLAWLNSEKRGAEHAPDAGRSQQCRLDNDGLRHQASIQENPQQLKYEGIDRGKSMLGGNGADGERCRRENSDKVATSMENESDDLSDLERSGINNGNVPHAEDAMNRRKDSVYSHTSSLTDKQMDDGNDRLKGRGFECSAPIDDHISLCDGSSRRTSNDAGPLQHLRYRALPHADATPSILGDDEKQAKATRAMQLLVGIVSSINTNLDNPHDIERVESALLAAQVPFALFDLVVSVAVEAARGRSTLDSDDKPQEGMFVTQRATVAAHGDEFRGIQNTWKKGRTPKVEVRTDNRAMAQTLKDLITIEKGSDSESCDRETPVVRPLHAAGTIPAPHVDSERDASDNHQHSETTGPFFQAMAEALVALHKHSTQGAQRNKSTCSLRTETAQRSKIDPWGHYFDGREESAWSEKPRNDHGSSDRNRSVKGGNDTKESNRCKVASCSFKTNDNLTNHTGGRFSPLRQYEEQKQQERHQQVKLKRLQQGNCYVKKNPSRHQLSTAHEPVRLELVLATALEDCPEISRCLHNRDMATLSRKLFGYCTQGSGGEFNGQLRVQGVEMGDKCRHQCQENEILKLKRNLAKLNASAGRVEPPEEWCYVARKAQNVSSAVGSSSETHEASDSRGARHDSSKASGLGITDDFGDWRFSLADDALSRDWEWPASLARVPMMSQSPGLQSPEIADVGAPGRSITPPTTSTHQIRSSAKAVLTASDHSDLQQPRVSRIHRHRKAEDNLCPGSARKKPFAVVILRPKSRPACEKSSITTTHRALPTTGARRVSAVGQSKDSEANVGDGTGLWSGIRNRGIRDWGPEDWGEDAPTMAMLTTEAARTPHMRQQVLPTSVEQAKESSHRGGPVWRSIFAGGYTVKSRSTGSAEARQNGKIVSGTAGGCIIDEGNGSRKNEKAGKRLALSTRSSTPPRTPNLMRRSRAVIPVSNRDSSHAPPRSSAQSISHDKGDIVHGRDTQDAFGGSNEKGQNTYGLPTGCDRESNGREGGSSNILVGSRITNGAFEVAERYATTAVSIP